MNLSELYDAQFFDDYGYGQVAYRTACTRVASTIYDIYRPRAVVDWGCGAGLHLMAFEQLGCTVLGIDGVEVAPRQRAQDVRIECADLSAPLPATLVLPSAYDLALCVDVLEHIPEPYADQALKNITQGAQMLILSCAPPGQGGHHHVNERPRRYWIAQLAKIGWQYQRRETGVLEQTFLSMKEGRPPSWMYHNLCVYRPVSPSP